MTFIIMMFDILFWRHQELKTNKIFGGLFEKNLLLIQQYFKFGIVGILATLVHVSIFVTLIEIFKLDPYFCNVSAYLFALFVSFCGNFFWVFKRNKKTNIWLNNPLFNEFFKFFVVSLIGLSLNTFFVWFFVDFWETEYFFSVFFMVFATPVFVFCFNKFWVFR